MQLMSTEQARFCMELYQKESGSPDFWDFKDGNLWRVKFDPSRVLIDIVMFELSDSSSSPLGYRARYVFICIKTTLLYFKDCEASLGAIKGQIAPAVIKAFQSFYDSEPSLEPIQDMVNSPTHYQILPGIEVKHIIDAATDGLTGPEAYELGNALKYLLRYQKKGKPVEDLQKARKHVDWIIERRQQKEDPYLQQLKMQGWCSDVKKDSTQG